MMGHILIATAAYGRQPSLQDWKEGKDFRTTQGQYFSIRDTALLKREGYTTIKVLDRALTNYSFKVKL